MTINFDNKANEFDQNVAIWYFHEGPTLCFGVLIIIRYLKTLFYTTFLNTSKSLNTQYYIPKDQVS